MPWPERAACWGSSRAAPCWRFRRPSGNPRRRAAILPSLEQLRVLPRLAEITRTFLHFGLQDLVHSVGMHRILDQTSGILGWRADPALLDKPLPERFRLALEALGPAFVKLGQVLASRVDLLSPEWIRELGNLQDSVGAVPFAELEAQLVADLGRPVDEAFAAFEREPRAAASIAQVHRAVLADGQAVAVKIRRPGVEAAVEADLVHMPRNGRTSPAKKTPCPRQNRSRPSKINSKTGFPPNRAKAINHRPYPKNAGR